MDRYPILPQVRAHCHFNAINWHGGDMPVDHQGGNSTSHILEHGGDMLILFPVEDTIFTNNVFGVLIDNIHHIYQQCIKHPLELYYGFVNRTIQGRCLKSASQSAISCADNLRSPAGLAGLLSGRLINWRAKSSDEITLARAWRAKPCTWLSELTTI